MPKGVYIRSKETLYKISNAFRGHHHTEESKEKMRVKLVGRKQSYLHKMKRAKHGKYNPSWKGGVTPINALERRKFTKNVSKQVLERDKYTCRICGTKGGILHVDHIQSWSEYVELRFSMDNLRTLCRQCHFKVTFGYNMPKNSKWGKYHKGDYLNG